MCFIWIYMKLCWGQHWVDFSNGMHVALLFFLYCDERSFFFHFKISGKNNGIFFQNNRQIHEHKQIYVTLLVLRSIKYGPACSKQKRNASYLLKSKATKNRATFTHRTITLTAEIGTNEFQFSPIFGSWAQYALIQLINPMRSFFNNSLRDPDRWWNLIKSIKIWNMLWLIQWEGKCFDCNGHIQNVWIHQY